MELKAFLKSTEAIVVFGGIYLTVTQGWLWGIITAIAYAVLNVPNLYATVKGLFKKKDE